METGKTSKYLKYAIGEIILVMIGILLALQVNNWNQARQLQKEELKILKGLHQEFSENIMRFDTIYKLQEARRDGIIIAMTSDIEEFSITKLDSLQTSIVQQWTFDPYQGFYNSVINSGRIELISNDILKQNISRFQDLLKDYKEEENNSMGFAHDNLYPFIMDNAYLDLEIFLNIRKRTDEEKIRDKQNYIKIYQSNKSKNLLVFLIAHLAGIFDEGPILREEMVSIINLLESEIETHN